MNNIIGRSNIDFQGRIANQNSLTRFLALAAAVLFSLLVTSGLILLMHTLIYKEYVEPVSQPNNMAANIWAEERVLENIKEYEKPEKTEVIEAPKELVPEFQAPELDGPVALIPGRFNVAKGSGTKLALGQSGMLVKRVTASPRYPSRALSRGIEGFVDVRFDVTAFGSTENIRIIQAQPEGYFERSVSQAVAKYKYQPAMQDGEPMATPNVTERIRFSIEQ